MSRKKIAVIGAGAMGLACAYELLKSGHDVDIYEQDDRVGGMSASFDFAGLTVERFYHFVCGPDYPLLNILKELGIFEKLKWTETKMGFFYEGKLYKWGNPLYLLTFPGADLLSKLRYGLHVFLASKKNGWDDLDKVKADDWIKNFIGAKAYDIFWKPLFALKFYDYAANLSAAWIWTRIKRVALSRKNIFTEKMGYLEGGSAVLFEAMVDAVANREGRVFLQSKVEKIVIKDGKTKGIIVNGELRNYNSVIATIPLPYIPEIAPDLPEMVYNKITSLDNIGVVCVVFKLKHQVTENFWLNINDPSMQVPGMIEYSNLNPLADHILYVPFYLHKTHPKYRQSEQEFVAEVVQYLKKINADFSEEWILAKAVHRHEYAQPICPPGYLDMLPPIKTGIDGLYVADTSYYYPEDRSISESIRLGREIADMVSRDASL
jgi:protoporphyrinogen oxidase